LIREFFRRAAALPKQSGERNILLRFAWEYVSTVAVIGSVLWVMPGFTSLGLDVRLLLMLVNTLFWLFVFSRQSKRWIESWDRLEVVENDSTHAAQSGSC
jgi:hypothetical protein